MADITDRLPQLDQLLAEDDAAKYLTLSSSWLRKRRLAGLTPPYVRLGRRVAYARTDLDELILAGRVDPSRIR